MTGVIHSGIREKVCSEAVRWIGTPYRHQASLLGVGCDCLGLVIGIWRDIYGGLPETPEPYAPDWSEAGPDRMLDAARRHFVEVPASAAEPGDLLLFRWRPGLACKHAGILMSNGRFIHAYQGHAVLPSPLIRQWRKRIAAAFCFPPLKVDV